MCGVPVPLIYKNNQTCIVKKGNGVKMNEKKIWIVTDSNSGISIEEEEKYNVGIISMPFIIDGKEFYENLTIDRPTFFDYLDKNVDVKTSQPSIESLMNVFQSGLKENDEIIYIPMSSELSGSVMTARSVAGEFDGRVHVVDNHRISCTQKQSVLEAVALAKAGYSADVSPARPAASNTRIGCTSCRSSMSA